MLSGPETGSPVEAFCWFWSLHFLLSAIALAQARVEQPGLTPEGAEVGLTSYMINTPITF